MKSLLTAVKPDHFSNPIKSLVPILRPGNNRSCLAHTRACAHTYTHTHTHTHRTRKKKKKEGRAKERNVLALKF